MRSFNLGRVFCVGALLLMASSWPAAASFVAFESGQVRPLAMSPDGNRLFAVNTPDNRLEIFTISAGGLTLSDSVPVGMEPVSVAARNNNEVWVVNYLSDSISIIDVSASPARIIKTLLVGDEPADIVFAGTGGNRAFITTAHRGQNSPYTDQSNPGELITPGIGRADVWVFDVTNTGSSLGGDPVAIVTLFGDTPKALTVSPDGNTVYAAIFKSGNQTTVLQEEIICNSNESVPCAIKAGEVNGVGKLPPPNPKTISSLQSPETGLIVKYNGSQWVDELNTDWSGLVRFNLPDKDVFAIDADALTPVETDSFSNVGTVLFNMAVNPVSGKIYVANTDAINEVRFEGPGTSSTTVQGHLHESRITVIDPGPGTVTPIHLNKHINYGVSPAPAGVSDDSLATPKGIAVTADGNTLYVVAKGSGKVGVFNTATLENNTFTPDSANHITLSAGGPDGLLLDEANNRLYVTTRFDNAVSVIDTGTATEIDHIGLHNPEPPSVIAGRQFLYDAQLTSSNGEASCASCHIEGDKDELAWDLGNPDGTVIDNINPISFIAAGTDFHPMKGPMTTQTLRGMDNHGPMHWRGDRSGANVTGVPADALDENLSFREFNVAFEGLLGRTGPLTDPQMQAYADFILQVTPPPNPIRNLDNSLTEDQKAGSDYYLGPFNSDLVTNCNGCHTLDPTQGFFGTMGLMSFEGAIQDLKIPHLRNMYEKVGMFGMADIPFNNSGDNGHKGDQIRGFGYTHDGAVDTLERFHNAVLFDFSLSDTVPAPDPDVLRKQMVQFMFVFDSNLKPVVGQQITLTDTNSGVAIPRIDLLFEQANPEPGPVPPPRSENTDLIVKGILNGEVRGWFYDLNQQSFISDRQVDTPLDRSDLQMIATDQPGQPLTFTAVPLGSGNRIGINRDEDTYLDGDDLCPTLASPDQTDTDSDGAGDVCDSDDDNDGLGDVFEIGIGTNTLLVDSDGDGLSDFEEVAFDGDSSQYTFGLDLNPLSDDTDGDGLLDAVDPIPLTVNLGDGDMNADGSINAGDLLITTRIVIGLLAATESHLAHGDLYPAAAPDGVINIQDLILLQKLLLP